MTTVKITSETADVLAEFMSEYQSDLHNKLVLIARSMGWSTFRVTPDLDHHSFETLCASERNGTPCSICLGCPGARGGQRSVFIPAHGTGKRHFIEA